MTENTKDDIMRAFWLWRTNSIKSTEHEMAALTYKAFRAGAEFGLTVSKEKIGEQRTQTSTAVIEVAETLSELDRLHNTTGY